MSDKIRFPLHEIELVARQLCDLLAPACHRIEIAGSIRRGVPMVGDIELVAIPKVEVVETTVGDMFGESHVEEEEYNLLWKALDHAPEVLERLKWGQKYRAFRWPLDSGQSIQVDLFTARPENWGWIFLIRTGSADFSHAMAARPNQWGYTSVEGQVVKLPKRTLVETREEQDVFNLAHVYPVPPKDRTSGAALTTLSVRR